MIAVTIEINGEVAHKIHAVNVSEAEGIPYGKGKQVYSLSPVEAENIIHKFEDGAVELAIKMLKKIK